MANKRKKNLNLLLLLLVKRVVLLEAGGVGVRLDLRLHVVVPDGRASACLKCQEFKT